VQDLASQLPADVAAELAELNQQPRRRNSGTCSMTEWGYDGMKEGQHEDIVWCGDTKIYNGNTGRVV